MSRVKATNKKTGITYVYESESYWDKEKKQPRNRRKLIGKIDPVTGEIVPTRSQAKREKNTANINSTEAENELQKCRMQLDQQDKRLQGLIAENEALKKRQQLIVKYVKQITKLLEE